jgi:hypothetical protein
VQTNTVRSGDTAASEVDGQLLGELSSFPSMLDFETLTMAQSPLSDIAVSGVCAGAVGVLWGGVRAVVGLSRVAVVGMASGGKGAMYRRVALSTGGGAAALTTCVLAAIAARKRTCVDSEVLQIGTTGAQVCLFS